MQATGTGIRRQQSIASRGKKNYSYKYYQIHIFGQKSHR